MGAVLCGWWKEFVLGWGDGGASGYVCSSGLCTGVTWHAQVYVYACECKLVEERCACGSGCSF